MKRIAAVVVVVIALVAVSAGIAIASSNGDDGDRPITGSALSQASAAALNATGGGRVTGTEVGDEDGYYEVEVTLGDGRQVDVHLDQGFKMLGSKADTEQPDDQDSGAER